MADIDSGGVKPASSLEEARRRLLSFLAELSQLRAIFGNFAIIFGVKSCASIAEL